MNNNDIEDDIKKINEYIHDWYDNLTDEDGYTIETLNEDSKEFVQAIENILADRERLEKENEELKEKINKKDKTIENMRYIKNTSKYEDTILIDKDRTNCTRRNKFLIELSNGEFVEVNTLKTKANKYDRLVERIKEVRNSLEKDGFVGYADELMDILEEE